MDVMEFYCGRCKYVVTDEWISINGKVLTVGRIKVIDAVLGQPAWFLIKNKNGIQTFKTNVITAILPKYEVSHDFKQKELFYIKVNHRPEIIQAYHEDHAKEIQAIFA